MFLTLCGVKNSPKTPDPQRYRSHESYDIDALKEPAYIDFIGICEISVINRGVAEFLLFPKPN